MTKLLYLEDTSLYSCTGTLKSLGSDEKGLYLIFDQTVFYPQGGGQPADKGFIKGNAGDVPVIFVGFSEGAVRHYIPDSLQPLFSPGDQYRFEVDPAYRLRNAELHTAGHLISHVLEAIEPTLIPVKGYHFPDGSYVEFLNPAGIDGQSLLEHSNSRLAADVSADIPITAKLADFGLISRIRPNLAPFTPKDKPSRIVTIGDYLALPCGGTHISSTGGLIGIHVTKIKSQKGNLKVSYTIRN